LSQDLLNKPLPADYHVFFVFENSASLIKSQQNIRVYDLHNHPTIDVLLVAKQSIYRRRPESTLETWLRAKTQVAQLVIALFTAIKLLDELTIFTHFKMLKNSQKQRYAATTNKTRRPVNNRWQSELVTYTKQSLPEAILTCLHILHQLEVSYLMPQNTKQLQFDL
jgi:hypothetical protein